MTKTSVGQILYLASATDAHGARFTEPSGTTAVTIPYAMYEALHHPDRISMMLFPADMEED